MNLGKAIKELRKQKNITQNELASRAKISQTALSQIENGKRPGVITLQKISKALSVSEALLYLLGIEESDVPKKKHLLYEKLFPVIKAMVFEVASSD